MRWFVKILISFFFGVMIPAPKAGLASEYMVYSVFRGLNLGGTEEQPLKDFYINMGSKQGVQEGMTLQVFRKTATYDVTNEHFYRDVVFPIALVKVIHVEPQTAVARLDKMLPPDQTPSISPRTIMAGDLVRAP